MHKSIDSFGALVDWNNPRGDRRLVLVKVRVIQLRLVPKRLVVRQIGGARQCWMVVVTMLRSNDWNAHLPEVPPAGEDPPPPDGIPHPLHGEGLNAEQLYQQQLHNWMAQNAVADAAANEGENVVVDEGNDIEIHPEWGVWPPPPPQAPPALYNFQQWLAGEGPQVDHGIVPP